ARGRAVPSSRSRGEETARLLHFADQIETRIAVAAGSEPDALHRPVQPQCPPVLIDAEDPVGVIQAALDQGEQLVDAGRQLPYHGALPLLASLFTTDRDSVQLSPQYSAQGELKGSSRLAVQISPQRKGRGGIAFGHGPS